MSPSNNPTDAQLVAALLPEEQSKPAPEKDKPRPIPDGAPTPYPGEVVMWRDEVAKSRKKGIKDKWCRCVYINNENPPGFYWWETYYGIGSVAERDRSPQMKVNMATQFADSKTLIYVVMDEEEFKKNAPPARRCKWDHLVSTKTREMLKSAPLNETFRAMLMAEVHEMPPKEADTLEKIKDWVEFNFPKEVVQPKVDIPPLDVSGANRSYTENGWCKYSRTMRYTGNVRLTGAELLNISAASSDEPEFKRRMYELVNAKMADQRHSEVPGSTIPSHYDVDNSGPSHLTFSTVFYRYAFDILAQCEKPDALKKFGVAPHPSNPYLKPGSVQSTPVVEEEEQMDPFEDHEEDRI